MADRYSATGGREWNIVYIPASLFLPYQTARGRKTHSLTVPRLWLFVRLCPILCSPTFTDLWLQSKSRRRAVATLASLASVKARLFLVSFTTLQFWCTQKVIILSIILSIASLYQIACGSWWRAAGILKYFTGCFPRLPSESLLLSCLQWQQLNQLTKKCPLVLGTSSSPFTFIHHSPFLASLAESH